MISQLLATIMMALGVASGTKATSNTFYDAEKPQQKRAIEGIEEEYRTSDKMGSYYEYRTPQNPYYKGYEKYYLNNTNDLQENPTYIQALPYGTMYNTIYTTSELVSTDRYRTNVYLIMKITTYSNSVTKYKLNNNITFGTSGNPTILSKFVWYTYENKDELIDITITANLQNTLDAEYNNNPDWNQLNYSAPSVTYNSPITMTYENESSYLTIQPNTTIYITMLTRVDELDGTSSGAWNIQVAIDGQYNQVEITTEIVDIPGIMFTVLTMPFSFISTAFNLTIFPNTPYQINFANLFMVILATFILMWIIKKVFH